MCLTEGKWQWEGQIKDGLVAGKGSFSDDYSSLCQISNYSSHAELSFKFSNLVIWGARDNDRLEWVRFVLCNTNMLKFKTLHTVVPHIEWVSRAYVLC